MLKIYIRAYEITDDSKFLPAIDKCIDILLSKKLFPRKKAFLCRTSFGKDYTNGLIGQAWILEALILAGRSLDKVELIDIASKIFTQHHFNEKYYLWHDIDLNGNKLPIKRMINQQIYFASIAAMLSNSKDDKFSKISAHFLVATEAEIINKIFII